MKRENSELKNAVDPDGKPLMASIFRALEFAEAQLNDPKSRDSILRSVETDN